MKWLPARWRRSFENPVELGSIGDAPGPAFPRQRLAGTQNTGTAIHLEAFQNVPQNVATLLYCPSPRFGIGAGNRLVTPTMSANRQLFSIQPFLFTRLEYGHVMPTECARTLVAPRV